MKQVLDLTKTYSPENRTKILAVKMTPDESKYVAEVARSMGHSLSMFTREALQEHITKCLLKSQ
jgi:hypothetical protein